MKARRLLVPAIVAVGLLPLVAAPASAAPPANDVPAGAVPVHLGDRVVQDTSEATTDAQDQALNANCGAPETNASVWYTYTPAADHKVAIDVSASSYSAGVMVFRGAPTADSLLTCGPGVVGLKAHAGKTYTLMLFSDNAVNGGKLVLSLKKAPTPHVHVSVAKRGVAYHGGAARIHGSFRCTHSDSFAVMFAHLRQRAGRLKIASETDKGIQCDGVRHRWSARMVSPVGTYAEGRGVAKVKLIVCGIIVCRHATARHHVQLSWAPKAHRDPGGQSSTARVERPRPLVDRQRYWTSR